MSDRTHELYQITLKKIRDGVSRGSTGFDFLLDVDAVVAWVESQGQWSVNTKKSAYIALTSLLRDFSDSRFNTALEAYRERMLKYRDAYNEVAAQQRMSEREKALYIPWASIIAAEQKLYESISTLNEWQDYVIYCLYTMVPPMRLDYSPMRVLDSPDELNDVSGNCLVRCGKRYKFYMREYKTQSKYGELVLDIPRRLQRVLEEWLLLNPSGWLLCDQRGVPLTETYLGSQLQRVMSKATGKALGASMLRHCYITAKRKGEKPLAQQTEMARAMAHSIGMSQLYRRID